MAVWCWSRRIRRKRTNRSTNRKQKPGIPAGLFSHISFGGGFFRFVRPALSPLFRFRRPGPQQGFYLFDLRVGGISQIIQFFELGDGVPFRPPG